MSEGRRRKKYIYVFPKIKGLAEESEGVSGNTQRGQDRHTAARGAGQDGQD